MPFKHVLLLVLVSSIWGINYVAIKIGLNTIPPLTFSALRFLAVLFPAIFFVKKPDIPLRQLILYGLTIFVFQQALLFLAIHAGLSAGLASLLFQVQAFFTIGLASLFKGERPLLFQILGAIIAASGIVVVGFHTGGEVTTTGLILVILAALSGGMGNVLAKNFNHTDMVGIVVWASLVAFPPLALLSYAFEGPAAIMESIAHIDLTAFVAIIYIAYLTTITGYAIWNRMLSQHATALVAPFALLTPVFGMLGATIFLKEAYPSWKLYATLLIIGGLCLNQFGRKLQRCFSS